MLIEKGQAWDIPDHCTGLTLGPEEAPMSIGVEDSFFDIHCVLVTQVNDQKIQRQLTAGVFFSYKPAVVNYH